MVSSGAFPSLCDLDRALQRELAALATLEAAHRSACRWLDEWSGPTEVKEHVACRLEARHRTEREAHVLRLADLHQQQLCWRSLTRPADARVRLVAALLRGRAGQRSRSYDCRSGWSRLPIMESRPDQREELMADPESRRPTAFLARCHPGLPD